MESRQVPKPVALGAIFALLAILFGFGMGGAFGAFEDNMKKNLSDKGNAALESVYKGDVKAKDAVVSKSWSYFKRAHMHGGGIGAAAIGTIAALVVMTGLGAVAQASALAFGLGSLLYSLFWLFAGLAAPELGSTDAAKESLRILAIPGAGLSILGALGAIFAIVKDALAGTPNR